MKNLYNFPEFLLKLLFNYLSHRSFKVSGHDLFRKEILSDSFIITAGTPQGSILAPLLYNIYLSDIPNSLYNNCKTIMYADDTVVYSSHLNAKHSANCLNAHLKYLLKYFNKWKIKINVEKTESIVFRRPATRKRVPLVEIKLNEDIIPIKNTIKYLGVHYTNLFKFTKHIKSSVNKCEIALSKLSLLLNPHKDTHRDIKILIYKQLVRPILSYAYPI